MFRKEENRREGRNHVVIRPTVTSDVALGWCDPVRKGWWT